VAVTVRPVAVVVAPISLRMVSWLGQWPAAAVHGDLGDQAMFDLVPFAGARREVADAVARPVSAANAASSVFQVRRRLPLEPPLSAVISSWSASGWACRPRVFHQFRRVFTANAAVSWSVPTLTHPVLVTRS
jgi:hypothetical protein